MGDETKIIYHIDDESTPYLIKLPVTSDCVTLGDFKNALNRPNYKFFFKSMDDDFGVVKEEIIDDDHKLPCFNGRVVSWLVAAENSLSDSQSNCTEPTDLPGERLASIGDSRPPSFHAQTSHNRTNLEDSIDNSSTATTDNDCLASNRRDRNSARPVSNRNRDYQHHMHDVIRINGHGSKLPKPQGFDATSSILSSSDLDSTSFFDSEDDASSRFSSATDTTCSAYMQRYRQKRRRRHRPPPISRASSFSSITDSTMSLNIITVTLNMDTINFLGISIVGQSNKSGDGGIYVGSIMKGGAVAQDGRIEPGDMILEVNGVSFENMSNDGAVGTLRDAVQKPGPITLVVAKCWDPNPKGYFTVPRQEPVRPIDPGAWVAHTTNALQGRYLSTSSMTSSSSNTNNSDKSVLQNLTAESDMASVVRAMAQPDSGLDIRDRQWLKITIPNAFIGSDLVDWLNTHIDGFANKKDARKYACNLLKAGFIRHTVNKLTFSEQCYYVFGDICGASRRPLMDLDCQTSLTSTSGGSSVNNLIIPNMTSNLSSLTLGDIDSVSEVNHERDILGPLPPPQWAPHAYTHNPYGPSPFLPAPNQNNSQTQPFLPPPPMRLPYAQHPGVCDTASYVSMPHQTNGNGTREAANSIYSGSGGKNTCACFVSHTYKQLKKLWIDKGKEQQQLQCPHGKSYKIPSYFDPDIDRSTSSSCGSSASDKSQKRKEVKDKPVNAADDSDATSSVVERALPPPPRQLQLQNDDLSASRQSFRLAMGNPCDDFQDMGRI